MAKKMDKLFTKPFYRCKVNGKFYTVDVTLSAPPQTKKPSPIIPDVVVFLQNEGSKIICDFGAGKLRNLRRFLDAEFTVYAVEYEKQFTESKAGNEMLESLHSDYPKTFKKLIFPHEFFECTVSFDAVLLVFVTHIIPKPKDRHTILKSCAEKLRKGGILFWSTPGYDTHMRRLCNDEYKYRDGWILHMNDQRQTFYTEFKVKDIDAMVKKHGFEFVKRLEFYKNPARLYRK